MFSVRYNGYPLQVGFNYEKGKYMFYDKAKKEYGSLTYDNYNDALKEAKIWNKIYREGVRKGYGK